MDIAQNDGSKPVTRSVIAERQDIPLPYLTQVLRSLVNGGLLKSNRGPAGGYTLKKKPHEISILDVITLLQGPVLPSSCTGQQESDPACDRYSVCGLASVWSELKSANEDVLGRTSLKDVMTGRHESPAESVSEVRLDCIGVSCPLPIVRVAEKIRELGPGEMLEVWVDDEGARADIPAWCTGTGNELVAREEFGSQTKFLIRKTS